MCVPTEKSLTEHVATPALSAWRLQVSMVVPLSVKLAVPVGVPLPGALAETVAVNVVGCRNCDGLTLLVRTVEVASCATS